jgi:nicotinamide-nucleotide amidase
LDQVPEEWLGPFLTNKGWRLTTAESCTGGLIAHRVTNVSGSSNYFDRGFVTYSNEAKMEILKVPEDVLIAHGAVSEPCARAMAEGVKKVGGSEVGVSVTGIAGPSGGSPDKPVGTVFMAVSLPSGTMCQRFLFHGDRLRIKEQTAEAALQMLREALQKEE